MPKRQSSFTINGRFVGKRQTGVQRYAREITLELDRLIGDEDPAFGVRARLIVGGSPDHDLGLQNISTIKTPLASNFLWTQFLLPWYCRGVTLSLENIASLPVRRQVVCIHDLNTRICPDSYSRSFRCYYRLMVPLGIRRASSVVTVSSFSAVKIAELGVCTIDKINIIPNGHEHVRRWDARNSQLVLGDRPFVFVLGSQARHKNLEVIQDIAEALDRLGLDIVVAGPKAGAFRPINAQNNGPNIRFLGYVSDDDLAFLYQKAFCFAFPSLTEGFGLPALEALALGCPVIASNAASLPEVCGSAALYADPSSRENWLTQFTRLVEQPDLRKALSDDGLKQAQKFSWSASAQLYWDLIVKTSEINYLPDALRLSSR